jgi:hypothetical protein
LFTCCWPWHTILVNAYEGILLSSRMCHKQNPCKRNNGKGWEEEQDHKNR